MKQLWAGVVLAMTTAGFGALHVPTVAHADDGSDAHVVVDDPKLVGARDDARREHARRIDRATTTARVLVEVDTADTEGVARGLRRIGAIVNGSVPGSVVQALVPVDSLEAVAAFGAVRDLQYPRRQGYVPSGPVRRTDVLPQPKAAVGFGSFVGNGVVPTHADTWHTAGFTGSGVKVGIVDYFDLTDWNPLENGDRPDSNHMFCKDSFSTPADPTNLCDAIDSIRDSGEIHGNAVAEIVKDVAPGAEIFIASVATVTDLKAAIDWFASNGVTVMTRSLGSSYDGPGDGTGPLAKAVDYAVAKGITWFNSAGNEGEDAYMKKVVKTTVAVDGGNYVNVNDGSPVVTPAIDTWLRVDSFGGGCFFMDGVRWANDWYLPVAQRTDYSVEFWQPKLSFSPGDIYSHRNPTLAQVEPLNLNNTSFGNQGGRGSGGNVIDTNQRATRSTPPPLEAADIGVCPTRMSNLTDGSFVTYIRIKRNAITPVGAAPDKVEIAIAGPAVFERNYFDRAGSAAKPVVDSKNPGLVSVGAVDLIQRYRLNGADGQSIAWYSSQGPTTDGRTKPDVASIAGVNSWTYATLDPASGGTFSGTSAASPTAAGLAALLQGAGLATTPAATAALVKNQVVDKAPTGPDNAYGFGLTQLSAPPTAPDPTAPVGKYMPLTPERIYDSRKVFLGQPVYSRAAGSIINLPIPRLTGSVPAGGASAVAVNITSVGSRTVGFVQAFPWHRTAFGSTSTLNVNKAGEAVANFAIVPVGDADFISLYLPIGGHVIVDLLGWFTKTDSTPADGRFVPSATPAEIYSQPVSTGFASNTSISLDPLAGDLTAAGQAEAVVVNITASGANRGGYLRAAPSGLDASTLPNSTVNFTAGAQVTNMAIVPLGGDGKIQVFLPAQRSLTNQLLPVTMHVKVDLIGYITSGAAAPTTTGTFTPIAPTRMYDSRQPLGNPPVAGGTTPVVTVGGVPNIAGGTGAPADAIAYSGNLTVTQPAAGGTLMLYTGVTPSPGTINVSYAAKQTVANGALFAATSVPGSPATTTVNAFMSATGHVIIDINGYFLP